ncbi:GlxA family transcriptional regulator [Methylobacterium sp. WSM2598]|uniref:GlxA family transcriptional regulator n=1 Tax=Methylobacterium sp. WSM2598 TaxID=398261 RepID=UPI000365A0AA|nr:helix-turn-helix domain-containing protein [Methylobacterium sp. WSM2598]
MDHDLAASSRGIADAAPEALAPARAARTIGLLVLPGAQLMSLAALAAFQSANALGARPAYAIRLVSQEGGPVPTAAGFRLETEPFPEAPFDTLMVGAFAGPRTVPAGLAALVRRAAARARRVAATCTGAFVLAEAGLLDGLRATTHWRNASELQARYPAVRLERDRLYVGDGTVWTSAGMAASIDLALRLVEDDLGPETAREVARRMLLERRRSGGQPQLSRLLDLAPKTDRIERVLDYARRHLREDLTVARLAEAARLSPRQFSRAFRQALGQPPAKVVERLRVEAARAMLVEGRHSLDVIAAEVGFADRERMRRAFLRLYGQSPQALRRAGHPAETA